MEICDTSLFLSLICLYIPVFCAFNTVKWINAKNNSIDFFIQNIFGLLTI